MNPSIIFLDQGPPAPAFQPLRDMGLHSSKRTDHEFDEFGSIEQHHMTMPKQQHVENWLDGSEFESPMGGNHAEYHEPITAMTIRRLEEQIEMLRIKVEGINARLENVTSILQETHPGNVKSWFQSVD